MDTQSDNVDNGQVKENHQPKDDNQFKELFESVDDLIERIAATPSPEVQKIRAKVRVALSAARSAARDSAKHLRRQASKIATSTDGYVRQSPWQSAALLALVGFVAGIAVTRRRSIG